MSAPRPEPSVTVATPRGELRLTAEDIDALAAETGTPTSYTLALEVAINGRKAAETVVVVESLALLHRVVEGIGKALEKAVAEVTPVFWMQTDCCGCDVLGRSEDLWTDGESDRCPDCGDVVWVSADENGVHLAQADEPPDNWPQPWPTAKAVE